jgi:hypothetical protein
MGKITWITTKWTLVGNKIKWSEVLTVRGNLGKTGSCMAQKAQRLGVQECCLHHAVSWTVVDMSPFLITPSLQYGLLKKRKSSPLKLTKHSLREAEELKGKRFHKSFCSPELSSLGSWHCPVCDAASFLRCSLRKGWQQNANISYGDRLTAQYAHNSETVTSPKMRWDLHYKEIQLSPYWGGFT